MGGLPPEMVVIPPGSFRMGDLHGGGYDSEKPIHHVRIDYDFAVGKFEVTFAQWDTCLVSGGCRDYQPENDARGRGERPVINLSWGDAKAYVEWLGGRTGKDYRLLSEAEWEYVARAGTTTEYSWGNHFDPAKAHNSGNGGPFRAVGSYEPNAFGLHDVHGNVWEWVEDCQHASYQGAPNDGSAWSKGGDCTHRVLRGGYWYGFPRSLRAAYRSSLRSGYRLSNLGFRVARTLSQ
jgi:formylglycine-generating enzyme required for sulfatase activity